MKVVILAGGYGTRFSEESHLRPKPMIEIGGKPILWHIMKEYSYYGFYDFIICAGYKQHVIKEWFANYFLHNSDVTFDFSNGKDDVIYHDQHCEPWRVTIVDTGLDTLTGGRIKRIQPYIGNNTFMLSYGDGVCDVDINALLEYHRKKGKIATLTSVNISQTKGVIDTTDDGLVKEFREKSEDDTVRINGGYMVFEPKIFDYLNENSGQFEKIVIEQLSKEGQLAAYKHEGFWQCMDTKWEMELLEKRISAGNAVWMKWER
jgi:glucose-1-phosphate cytidylyltransferase